jgi:hypothetical protein
MELLLLVLRNNQPADFIGTVPLKIFAFLHRHHHLKYDLTDLLHNFWFPHKTALLGF